MGTEGVLAHNAYSPATVQSILATLTVANAGKWTSFVDRVVSMNVPIAQRTRLYEEISKITNSDDLVRFLDDFDAEPLAAFRQAITAQPELVNAWKIMAPTRPILRTQLSALEAVTRIKANPKFTELGLTDDILARIKSHKNTLGEDGYAEVINDLNSLGNLMHSSGVQLENFGVNLNKLIQTSGDPLLLMNNRQGVHGVVKQIIDNPNLYSNQILQFNKTVASAGASGNGFVDILVGTARHEVKWLTSRTVNADEIIREFINRDLFSAASLDEIHWFVRGMKPTKENVVNILSSVNGRAALGNISPSKAATLLDNRSLVTATSSQIEQAFIDFFNIESNFIKIFQ